MKDHDRTYLERALAARFSFDAARFGDLADRVADVNASLGHRAVALAGIAEWLDHVAGHPETDSPAANFTEAILVGLTERLCPELIGDLRVHRMADS